MSHPARRTLLPVLTFLAIALLLGAAAHAGNIQQVSASPSSAAVGQTVQLTVTRGGSGNCGAILHFGDGESVGPFGFGTNPRVFTHVYAQTGSFTVTAAPRRRNNLDPCNGAPQTTVVTVTPGSGMTLERSPVGSKSLQKLRPKAAPAPSGEIRPIPPRAERAPDEPMKRLPPKIQNVQFVPSLVGGKPFQAAPGVLAPGGRLEIHGMHLGVAGSVLLDWAPSPKPLEIVEWSNTRVVGIVPELGGELGERYTLLLRLERYGETDEDTQPGNNVQQPYEIPHEVRVLTMDDPAVELVTCGMDGNVNQCQRLERGDDCGAAGADFLPPPQPTPTIYARHLNCWGAVGDDYGVDRFRIRLANGWTLHELLDAERELSSGDESAEALAFTPGADYGDYDLNWVASPNDSVRYWYRMSIIGRMGTSHH